MFGVPCDHPVGKGKFFRRWPESGLSQKSGERANGVKVDEWKLAREVTLTSNHHNFFSMVGQRGGWEGPFLSYGC